MEKVINMLGRNKGALIKGAAVIGSAVLINLLRTAAIKAKVGKERIVEFPDGTEVTVEAPVVNIEAIKKKAKKKEAVEKPEVVDKPGDIPTEE